jgi:ketosteroid isomerase-like protein
MLRKLWLGGALTAGAVAVVALTVALSACGGSDSDSVDSELQRQVDLYAIGEIEKDFHESMSKKDLDQMMSLWTKNATMTGGVTATGKAEIRKFWAATPPFQPENKWVSDHPAYKLEATVDGDRGTLFFQCHFIDVKTEKVALVTALDADVRRIEGRWLITNSVGSAATLTP